MRALTVQQPWAWAIVQGGKDVENRTQAWSYRGPLAIHAGQRWSDHGARSNLIGGLYLDKIGQQGWGPSGGREAWLARQAEQGLVREVLQPSQFGAFIGIVDLVDVHQAESHPDWTWCCQPWGEAPGVLLKADGKFTRPKTHLVLRNQRPLDWPIPCAGKLGLWTPPADILDELRAVV